MAAKKSKGPGPPYWMMPDPRESQFMTLDEDQIRYLQSLSRTRPPSITPPSMPAPALHQHCTNAAPILPQPLGHSPIHHNVTPLAGAAENLMTQSTILAPQGMPAPTKGPLLKGNFLPQPQVHSPMHRNVTPLAGTTENSMTRPSQGMPAPTMGQLIDGNFLHQPRGHSPMHRNIARHAGAAEYSMTGPPILAPQGMPAPTMEPVIEGNFLPNPRGHSPMHRNVIPLAGAAANSFGYADYHGPGGISYRTCLPPANEHTASYQNAPVHGFDYGNVDVDIPTRQQPLADDRLLPVPAIGGGEDEVGASNARVVVLPNSYSNSTPYSYISDATLKAWRSKQHITGDSNPSNAVCRPAGCPVMIRPYDPSQLPASVPRFLTPIQQPPVPHLLRPFKASPGSANTLPLQDKQFENTDIVNSRQVVYSGPSSYGQLAVSNSYVKHQNVMFSNPADERAVFTGAENVEPHPMFSQTKSRGQGMKKVKILNKSADDKFSGTVKQCPPPDDSTCSKIVQKAEHYLSDEYLKEHPDILDQLKLKGYISGRFLRSYRELQILASDWPVLRSAIMRKSKLLVINKDGDQVKRAYGLPRELRKPRELFAAIIGIRLPSVYVREGLVAKLFGIFGELRSICYYRPAGIAPSRYLGAYTYLIPDLGSTMCCVAEFEELECALTAVRWLNKDSREPERTMGKKHRPKTGLSKTPILKHIEEMPDLEDARFAKLEPRMLNNLYPEGIVLDAAAELSSDGAFAPGRMQTNIN